MRWSNALIPTLKETPADAVAPSHILLLRAGMIRQLGAGAYTYLPLGLRVLQKASQIVRRGDGRRRGHRAADAGLAADRDLEGIGPVRDLRRPAHEADHQRRPPDVPGPDPRGGDHRPGTRPDQLLQAVADHDVPDPDQVPRRAAAAVRHRPDPRVRDEGRVQLRRRRRPAQQELRRHVRGLLPDLRPVRPCPT